MSEGVLYGDIILGNRGGERVNDTVSSSGRIARIRWQEFNFMEAFSFDEIPKIGGSTTKRHHWGGDGGNKFIFPGDPKDVLLDSTYINGIYVQWDSVVDFMKLYIWNRATSEPYAVLRMGKEKPVVRDQKGEFYFNPKLGDKREICGFAAYSGTYLDGIGVYVREHRP